MRPGIKINKSVSSGANRPRCVVGIWSYKRTPADRNSVNKKVDVSIFNVSFCFPDITDKYDVIRMEFKKRDREFQCIVRVRMDKFLLIYTTGFSSFD